MKRGGLARGRSHTERSPTSDAGRADGTLHAQRGLAWAAAGGVRREALMERSVRQDRSNLLAAALPLLALFAGLPLLVLISWALRGAGDSTEPFETKGGTATRLDGTKATVQ